MRTNYCGKIDTTQIKQTVVLCGWVNRVRDHGGVIFVDLRDRYGIIQVVCDPNLPEVFVEAEKLHQEYCLKVTGEVRPRPDGTINTQIQSGYIEVLCHSLEILNPSLPPIFALDDDHLAESTRLLHRVLDLRRPYMQGNLMLRHQVTKEVRK